MVEITQKEIHEVRGMKTHVSYKDFTDAEHEEIIDVLLLRLERAEAAKEEYRKIADEHAVLIASLVRERDALQSVIGYKEQRITEERETYLKMHKDNSILTARIVQLETQAPYIASQAEVLRRIAERARSEALRSAPSMVDICQHMVDETMRLKTATSKERNNG